MKRLALLAVLLSLAGTFGCDFFRKFAAGGGGAPGGVAGVEPIRRSGNSSLAIVFRLPGQASASEAIHPATVSGMRVAFILKIINPGHPEEPYTQVRQDVDVVNGVASATFQNLPANSVVGEVAISSGTYRGFSDFHGAIDLAESLSSTLAVSPVGSSEDPAQVAQVIKDMLVDPAYFGYIQSQVAATMQNALVESRNRVGTDSAQLLVNTRDSYLALTSEKPATMDQTLEAAKEFMTGFEVYKDRSYADQPVAATPANVRGTPAAGRGTLPEWIRAAFNSWSWDPELRSWSYTQIFTGPYRKYAYSYMTSRKDIRYQYITDSPDIDRLVTSSEIYVTYGTERVTITDVNEYVYGSAMQRGTPWFDHVGTTWAKGSSTGREIWRVTSNLRYCHVASKYPGIGWVEIWDNVNQLLTKYTFNGTCVAKAEIVQDNRIVARYFVFLDFADGEPMPGIDPKRDQPPAGAPINVRAIATHSNIIVTWSPVPGATGYDLYHARASDVPLFNCDRLPFVESPALFGGEVSMFSPRYIRIIARSTGGESPPSAEVATSAFGPPPATGLRAQVADGKILLSWNKVTYAFLNDPDYYEYLVLGATQPLDLSTIGAAVQGAAVKIEWAGGNQITVASLTNRTTYYMTVLTMGKRDPESNFPAPFNRYGLATPVEQISASPLGNGILLPPTNVRVDPGYLNFSVSWLPPTWSPTPAAAEYRIFTDVGTYSGSILVSATRVPPGPDGRCTWNFQRNCPAGSVASVAVQGIVYPTQASILTETPVISVPSESASATVHGPYPVTDLLAIPASGANTITWTYPADRLASAAGFNLYWKAGPFTDLSTAQKIVGITSPYVQYGLNNGTRYFYVMTVDAVSNLGESDASGMVSAIPRPIILPAIPGNVTVTASASANVIDWTPVDLATSYTIYWGNTSTVSRSTGTPITGLTQPPFRHGGLTSGIRYSYVVTSVGAEGESVESPVVSAVPQ